MHVERAHLLPQAVHFAGKIIRRHVVLRSPERAGVLESQFPRALIGKLDEAHKILAHGPGNLVPARPGIAQFLGVAARGHQTRQVLDVQALVFAGRAPLSFAVSAFHARGNLGDLRTLAGIGRSGKHQGNFQEQHLARQVGGQLQAVEARGLLGEFHLRGNGALVRLGRQNFRVVGDVGGLYPIGAAGVHAEFKQFGFGVFDEGFRLRYRRWLLRRKFLVGV